MNRDPPEPARCWTYTRQAPGQTPTNASTLGGLTSQRVCLGRDVSSSMLRLLCRFRLVRANCFDFPLLSQSASQPERRLVRSRAPWANAAMLRPTTFGYRAARRSSAARASNYVLWTANSNPQCDRRSVFWQREVVSEVTAGGKVRDHRDFHEIHNPVTQEHRGL